MPAPPPNVPLLHVFVVEDQRDVRRMLGLVIDGAEGFACAGTAGSAEEALEATPEPPPDVVLLDIGLPGRSGIEALPDLRAHWPDADVLILTVLDDDRNVFDALCAGATGYLLKATPPAEILTALQEVHAGGAPMSASVARRVVDRLQEATPPRAHPEAEPLSEREQEVLDRLAEGKTYRQIGEELFISRNTVAYHVKRIYAKLHAKTRADLIAHALGHGDG